MYVDDQLSGVPRNDKAHEGANTRVWDATPDNYRARATLRVTAFALILSFLLIIYSFSHQLYALALGWAFIALLSGINVSFIANGHDHEPLTLFALLPGSIILVAYAFQVNGNIASIGCFPLIVASYCMLCRSRADAASVLIMALSAPMMWLTLEPLIAAAFIASLIAIIFFSSVLLREFELHHSHLYYQIDHDPMTGLLNRTSLHRRIENSIASLHCSAIPASLVTLDLDHFKRVNDVFGHDTGDFVLCEVARLLKENSPRSCTVFRLGGEEFLVLLTHIDENEARAHAESLRVEISKTAILPDFPITVSIGVANLRVCDNGDSWRRRSDNLLYMAKLNGRNQVASEGDVGPRQQGQIKRIHPTNAEVC